ncbi:hypothetical protein MNBD_GAMMA22-926 [hydrothermal vent metagenome]|uniref:Uncharacterized protein n=1 Tax=hydrothermal vent metagenome TaxID=652676 RepID=A0A3B1AN98_9ZZZZ
MPYKSYLLMTIFLTQLSSESYAQEIEGAFGQKLGSVSYSKKQGILMWEFVPKKPNNYFQEYYYYTSPDSKKIFSIIGLSKAIAMKDCRKNAKSLMAILEAKYGKANKSPPSIPLMMARHKRKKMEDNFFVHFKRINKSPRFIETACLSDLVTARKKINNKICNALTSPYSHDILSKYSMSPSKNSLFSRSLISYSRGKHLYGFNIYPLDLGAGLLYPSPSLHYGSLNMLSCGFSSESFPTRLMVMYVDTNLEAKVTQEFENIRKKRVLKNNNASGL